jgi:hypothetical protein
MFWAYFVHIAVLLILAFLAWLAHEFSRTVH